MGWGPQDPYAGGGIDSLAQQFIGQNQQMAQGAADNGYQVGHHKGPLSASGANNYKQFVPADSTTGVSGAQGPTQNTIGDFNNQNFGVQDVGQQAAASGAGGDAAAGAAGAAAADEASIAALF